MSILTVEGLNKQYPSFQLQDVSFMLESGRIAGFVGRNGAGKTTAIKSMLNLIHPDSGEITYFGMPLTGNEAQIKQRIGYSTGTVSWYPRKKLKEIVRVTKSFYPNWDDDFYDRYRKLFQLDENKMPLELSAGMKVKFNLLLALSHKAELLILDEPTSGLDPFSRDEILDIFMRLREEGTSVFFSTHIISDLEKCADDIIYISGGRIQAAMPQQDFLKTTALPGETLEQMILRLEKEGLHE